MDIYKMQVKYNKAILLTFEIKADQINSNNNQ